VRERFPNLDPKAGPGAARSWRRLVRLAEVAEEYRTALERGEKAPATVVAGKRGVTVSAVNTWLHHARREGFDAPFRLRRGGTSLIVRTNIRTLREQHRMTYEELSARLIELSHPIPAPRLQRLEIGDRRIDVDELAAFAKVFAVTPAQLLEPVPPPSCGTCHGTPPPGFACTECGTTTKETP
jgi:hypothetical protein